MSTKALAMSIANIHFLRLLNVNNGGIHNSIGFNFYYPIPPDCRISSSENIGEKWVKNN